MNGYTGDVLADNHDRADRLDTPTPEIAVTNDGSTTLPLDRVLTGRSFICGKSGSGKTNSVSVVAEELLARGIPLLIVDADGEYVGLKEQYEVLHAGAQGDADVQVTPADGATLARVALTQSVPVILDVSEFFDPDEANELVASVARTLYTLEKNERKPFLLVLEECHEWIPQNGADDVADMLIRVAKRGRKRGLGVAGLSQRPADVDKAFITQADWLVWHRLTWHNDVGVVRDVLGGDYADEITELDDGEAFLQTDWDADVKRVQWRRKDTPDLGAAPSVEKVLGTTPDDLRVALREFTDDGDAADGGGDEPDAATSKPERRTITTYKIHGKDDGTCAHAQLGKPAMNYLGAVDGDTLAVEQIDDDALVAHIADHGEWTYSIFDRGRGYAMVNVGAGAMSAIGAERGDRVRVFAGDECIRLEIDERGGRE